MILEQNIRPKTISVEVRNVKQNTWFEYIRMHKPDGWGIQDISLTTSWIQTMYYAGKPTIENIWAKDMSSADGMMSVRVKTLIGEQLFNNQAVSLMIDCSYAKQMSICKPGESGNAEIIEGAGKIKDYIQHLSKANKGFASFHYVHDNADLPWGKLKCNNGNVYHITFPGLEDYA